ncbi:alpha/beta hydrolase [Paludibaculum fermentans]|uniref:alpha/beta hydrolase n=1 Tax=Paludibaculum fermentans TaxID=1473598 RepID=UPI003EBA0B33
MKWLLPAILLATAHAQPGPAPKVINLWPATAPGSESWKQPETTVGNTGNRRIMNVSTPTLTAYLPDPSTATGTAVIIAPGGGFVWLSIDSEGHDVAQWLAARGIAGIVLKYRLLQVEGQEPAQVTQAATAALAAMMRQRSLVDDYSKFAMADGTQAVSVVRAHAAEWGISPDRVVLMGFSAGAILTSTVVLQSEARPNYAAPIYGGPFNEMPPIPQGLPPIFLAVAQDDAGAEPLVTRFHTALKAAGYKPELHVFSSGGHGFGMRKQGKSSDHWIDEFYYWLEAYGLTRPAK